MNWNGPIIEEPVKEPEVIVAIPEAPLEENSLWPERVVIPEAIHEENLEVQEPLVTPEAIHEENLEVREPLVIPEAVEATQLTWLKSEEIDELKSRWNLIQIGFVDEPRKSVEQADALVVDVLKHIEQAFTARRTTLDEHWVANEEISTEDLRIALQGYRSFFNRFLAV
jgi:hypothetical protein